ncbi:MAG TPA: hypothetical protein VK658_20185 [Chryseolinea sp.]|nr:hypothetical protein [Chryseolinea sp.]
MKVLNYINVRTFLAIAISQVAAFFAIHYHIKLNHNLLLFGIVVVFPLHFSLQAAFKRREKALEYLSQFKAGSMAIHNSLQVSGDLPDEQKAEARNLLKEMVATLIGQLEGYHGEYGALQVRLNNIMAFADKYREQISKRNVLRVIRYLKDVTESTTYLISLVRHRTMHGIRFYGTLFILLFPLLQAPIVLHYFGSTLPSWTIYACCALGSFVLITLDNFQKLIEYPFDPRGMDNIVLRDFNLDI